MDIGAIIGALARHVGGAVATLFAGKGWVEGSDTELVIGAVVAVAMLAWSIFNKVVLSKSPISGGVKSILAALIAIGLAGSLSACANGQLTPSAREKLETASTWAHRGSMAAHGAIIAITTTCESKTSAFCQKAMPIVGLASGALTIFDKALAAADAALANPGTTDEQMIAAIKNLIDLERDIEDYIAQIKVQQSLHGVESFGLEAYAPIFIDTKPGG